MTVAEKLPAKFQTRPREAYHSFAVRSRQMPFVTHPGTPAIKPLRVKFVGTYDEEAFCNEAQKTWHYFRRWAKSVDQADDDFGDFITHMLEKGYWKRFDPTRATLRTFVVQYLRGFATNRIASRKAAAKRKPIEHIDARVPAPTSAESDGAICLATYRARIAQCLTRDELRTFDALISAGGDWTRGAAALGLGAVGFAQRVRGLRLTLDRYGLSRTQYGATDGRTDGARNPAPGPI